MAIDNPISVGRDPRDTVSERVPISITIRLGLIHAPLTVLINPRTDGLMSTGAARGSDLYSRVSSVDYRPNVRLS